MALILCTGSDPETLENRRRCLEKEAHTVVTATNERELREACAHNKVDIAVLGHNMSER
jgi:CheY-like chemotaxis protein